MTLTKELKSCALMSSASSSLHAGVCLFALNSVLLNIFQSFLWFPFYHFADFNTLQKDCRQYPNLFPAAPPDLPSSCFVRLKQDVVALTLQKQSNISAIATVVRSRGYQHLLLIYFGQDWEWQHHWRATGCSNTCMVSVKKSSPSSCLQYFMKKGLLSTRWVIWLDDE